MTNDEIERRVAELVSELFPGQFGDTYVAVQRITRAIREAVIQAYEEAAQTIPEFSFTNHLAARIRSLKGSLDQKA